MKRTVMAEKVIHKEAVVPLLRFHLRAASSGIIEHSFNIALKIQRIDRSFYNSRFANIRKKTVKSPRFAHEILTNAFPTEK